jgi:tetratricopeptide (TPR) repeat protein
LAGIPAQDADRVKKFLPYLVLLLLVSGSFTLATVLQPYALTWGGGRNSGSVLKVLFGDGRRLFANHFFVKADVTFHGGYYPSIFDSVRAPKGSRHMTAKEGTPEEEEHERRMNFLGPPRDCFERFGRNFMITQHSHLEGANEREILPWMRISAELDPQRIDTYTVAAYFLRNLHKTKEAEQFLREGLRNNPDSSEILFELGRLYKEDYHDVNRARNVWNLALQKWQAHEANQKDPDLGQLDQIAINLGRLEEDAGNIERAITLLELAARGSPRPEALRQQIANLKKKLQ